MKSRGTWGQWVEEALRGPHLNEPGRGTLHRAIALGDQLQPKTRLGTWIIEAVFDSAAALAPAGVRGTGLTGERRLLFQCDTAAGDDPGHQLDLKLRTSPEGDIEVTGQFLPPWPDGRIEIRAGRTKRSRSLGAAGEFLVRGLPTSATTMDLQISGEGHEVIAIHGISLSPCSRK